MAKRFKFRFETMLKIRRRREDEHKRIVAARAAEIQGVNKELASLASLIDQEMDSIRAVQGVGRVDLQQAIARRNWVTHLHKSTLEAEARLRGLEARLAQERAALAEAAKQRKILEKLRERQSERHRLEMQRTETVAIDDLTTTRYVFNGTGDEAQFGPGWSE